VWGTQDPAEGKKSFLKKNVGLKVVWVSSESGSVHPEEL
jgi:hypothetical protein